MNEGGKLTSAAPAGNGPIQPDAHRSFWYAYPTSGTRSALASQAGSFLGAQGVMRYRSVYVESLLERLTRQLGLYALTPLLAVLGLAVLVQIPTKPDLGFTVHHLEVVTVSGPAINSGVQPGDIILQIAGHPIDSMPAYYAALASHHSLTPLTVELARQGQRLPIIIEPVPPSQARLIRFYSQWVVGLAFLMIGWWVLSKRHDPVARNFFGLCMIFAFFLMEVPDQPHLTFMWVKEGVRGLLQLLLPAYFLRFFIQFPAPKRTSSGQPDSLRWILLPGWLLFFLMTLGDLTGLTKTHLQISSWLELASLLYMVVYIVGGIFIFSRKIMRKDRPIEHTKMRVVLIGIVCGLIPFFTAAIVGNLAPGSALPQWQYLAFSLLLVPASFALAIMRIGALDRDFIIRTSLIYGLMTAMVLLGYFLVVLGVGLVFGQLLGVRSDHITLALVAISGLLFLPFKGLAQDWIDRTFYPARKANRQAMNRLAEELTGMIDTTEVLSVLRQSLTSLFEPSSLTIFLADDDDNFQLVEAQETSSEQRVEPIVLNLNSSLIRLLNRIRHPLFIEEVEDLLLSAGSDPSSVLILSDPQLQLIVPLVTGNRLLGFLTMGDKNGHALYSQEDLANLQSLAVQAAPLIESRQLYSESLQRKRMEAELELAREIQARLLPTEPLATKSFAIVGRNDPCRMVGGDFFDYFLRPDGSLALAIGDVSGKGIPAALLMTSLRVAFRSEAGPTSGSRQVITRLNRIIHGLVSQGRFVCFFFGILDPQTGLLTYCNAGMDPPVLFRAATGVREFLRRGGPVLGISPDQGYREGRLSLQKGDCVLFYTDGLTEQRNPQGEFFDIERLCAAVPQPVNGSYKDNIDRIFDSVEAFGSDGEPDDKTAMILQVNRLQP